MIECPYPQARIDKAIEGFKRFDPADPGMDWAVLADVQLAREAIRGLKLSKPLSPGARWFMATWAERGETP